MIQLNSNNLSEINAGGKIGDFFLWYLGGKVVDYVVEGTLNPSERSKEIARRAYGSKWNIIK